MKKIYNIYNITKYIWKDILQGRFYSPSKLLAAQAASLDPRLQVCT